MNKINDGSIGVFDSGVGGISVLRAIRKQLPKESVTYFGDQAHVPYGSRAPEEIREFSSSITRFLKTQDVKIIVVACNTASAVGLQYLRNEYPDIPFVGMEPAVKPAAKTTLTRIIGVLATPATFEGELYASLVERYAENITLIQSTCPGLVQQIEKGDLEGTKTRNILESALRPMLDGGIDRVVLGCTHYPFVISMIQDIVGSDVQVIDPSPAVARQVARVLEEMEISSVGLLPQKTTLFSTGNLNRFRKILPRLYGEASLVRGARWETGDIRIG